MLLLVRQRTFSCRFKTRIVECVHMNGVAFSFKKSLGLLVPLLTTTFLPTMARADQCTIDITQNSITFATLTVVENKANKIYATLTATCGDDVEGTIRFYDQGSLLSTKPFSIRSNGRAEEVWTAWMPLNPGDHEIAVQVTDDVQNAVSFSSKRVTLPVTVEKDRDGDGIPDRLDDDMDNDGLTNAEEARLGTDPLRMDTDGDGADDKRDAFPLDPNRSALPKPPPPTVVVPPKTISVPPPIPPTKTVLSTKPVIKPAPTPLPTPAPIPSTRPPTVVTSPVPPVGVMAATVGVDPVVSSSTSSSSFSTTTDSFVQTSSSPERWLLVSSSTASTNTTVSSGALVPTPGPDSGNPFTTHVLTAIAAVTALSGIAFFILSARA